VRELVVPKLKAKALSIPLNGFYISCAFQKIDSINSLSIPLNGFFLPAGLTGMVAGAAGFQFH